MNQTDFPLNDIELVKRNVGRKLADAEPRHLEKRSYRVSLVRKGYEGNFGEVRLTLYGVEPRNERKGETMNQAIAAAVEYLLPPRWSIGEVKKLVNKSRDG